MSGFVLKIIACLTMLVDHAAVVFAADLPDSVYALMRCVGRLAFVIFCFFIAEGFVHTRHRLSYALRLGLFALISEIPFDLVCFGRVMDLSQQNVYFTLLLGLLGIWAWDHFKNKNLSYLGIFCLLGCAMVAWMLGADYGAGGVMLIAVMYMLREHKEWQGLGVMAVLIGMTAISAPTQLFGFGGWLLCVAAYNGRRGPRLKYILYLFYPVHLLLLWTIRSILHLI